MFKFLVQKKSPSGGPGVCVAFGGFWHLALGRFSWTFAKRKTSPGMTEVQVLVKSLGCALLKVLFRSENPPAGPKQLKLPGWEWFFSIRSLPWQQFCEGGWCTPSTFNIDTRLPPPMMGLWTCISFQNYGVMFGIHSFIFLGVILGGSPHLVNDWQRELLPPFVTID